MSVVIALLILALIVVVAFWIIDMIPLPAPAGLIVKVIIGLLVLLKLFDLVGVASVHSSLLQ